MTRASELWDGGQLRRAFALFLSLAEGGHEVAELNVGYFFDCGLGVRRNRAKAYHWYRRAYTHGHASGANNIGTLYREHGDTRAAVRWFLKVLRRGNDGSALEIAKRDDCSQSFGAHALNRAEDSGPGTKDQGPGTDQAPSPKH